MNSRALSTFSWDMRAQYLANRFEYCFPRKAQASDTPGSVPGLPLRPKRTFSG